MRLDRSVEMNRGPGIMIRRVQVADAEDADRHEGREVGFGEGITHLKLMCELEINANSAPLRRRAGGGFPRIDLALEGKGHLQGGGPLFTLEESGGGE